MDQSWRSRGKQREFNTHKYGSTATSGAGMQTPRFPHEYLVASIFQFFFSNEPPSKIYARNAVPGTLFTAINVEKRQFEKSVDVEINNIMYMELYSGPEISDSKYLKS
jgi:hypothetical protein